MVKLRKSHNKLKIILCSVLGAIVAVGGVLGIWKLSTALSGDKIIDAPDNTVSVRKELPSGATYTQLHSDGLDTLGYLAYVLDRQEYYHSVANTVSTALIATQYTNSFKDYKDGIMLSSDFTYGFTGAGTQSCFVPDGNANGEGAGVYMRTSSGSVNGSTTGTGANWNDDVVYYDKEGYLYKYGQYSTEMTVYILNEETVLSWDDVVENGDGTYSQTFYLDAEKAAYYYQYAMQTRGGLDTLPEFESITLTFTFDDNYRVLRIDATEVSEITYIFSMSSTSQTTTTYSYEQETFDEAHYDYFDSYYSQYVGQIETGGDEPELDALTLLGTAFADVVNGTGDQFEATVTLGDSVYYGRIYLNVPMSAFSSSDVIGALDVRLALSADSLFDSQDLYIQLKDGEVSGYYSSDFALKVNINDFSQLISKFENWVSSLGGSSDTEVLAETSSDSGFSLEDILNGLVLTEREGGATIALNLDDLFGIGLSAELNFTSSEGENGTTYAFANASVGNISYNGSPISLSLALTPSSAETISHEESDSPFDLTVAANSLYELLNSETVSAQLTLEGDKLADVLANYNLADLGGSIDDLRLEITGSVDINGVTVGAQARIYRAGDNSDVLNADVYYEIDPSAGDYGTAYLNIKNILGAECDVKAYSNVSELVSAIEKIIARFGSEGGSAEVSALAEDSATDIAALINDILSLDFGSIIKEVQGNGTVIGATLNVDSVLAVLLGDVSVGDITLEYHLGDFEAENYNQNGGWLYGSLPSLGIEAYAYGSTASLTQPEKDEYLDINDLINSVLDILNSNTVKVGLDLEGESLAAVLNANGITGYESVLSGATLNVTGYASIKNTAAKADITLKNTEKTIFAASVYYAYAEGTYGIAYLNITNILGKSFSDLKVYCDISEIVTTIEGLLGSGVATLSETTEPETNEIADIISQLLNINFGAMVKELAANASGLTATADLDEILGEFAGVDLSLGTVTLNYNITSNTLSGEALNGGLDIIVSGDEMTISEPEDKDAYLDANKLLNSVLALLNSNTVKVGLDLEGESLAAVLNANGITGYESVLSGATLNVTGYASIKNTAAKADITLKNTEKTIFAASVYYAYAEGTYGIAYLNITNILGKSFSDLKVYCDISEIVTTIEGLLGSGVATLSETTEPETNEIADIISQLLNINFGAMVKELAANASGLTATADLDEILGEFAGVDLSLGTVTLNYNITSNTLSGEALNGGLDIIVSGDEMTISEPEDKDAYLDANKLLNSVLALLNSNTVKVGLDLEGESLAAVLNANGITGYDSVLSGATLNVTGYASIKNTAAKADITLKNTEKTIFTASVYYAYTDDGTYGIAYLNITDILGKSFTDLKVYCNISELAATIEGLLGSGVAELDETTEPETNEIADIISQVLNINFGAMVKELAANASGLNVTADLDEILGEFAGVDLGLGTVTLNYNITSNTLSGEALNGGLDIAVSGDEMTISEPTDKDTYLDANKLLNSVLDLLNKNTVTVDLEIKGAAVADILGKANIADIGAAIDGLTLKVNGGVSIDDLAAAINLTLVGKDSATNNDSATNEEKVYLDADIYYDYGDSGNADGENYGTAYISINELLGVSFVEENTASDENTVSKVKVYADIAAAKNNVEALIEQITQIIEGALTPAQADYAVSTYSEDGENAVAGIIARVLGIDFTEFVSEMRTSADGFTATADIDYILSYFSVGEYGLGDVTLTYSIKDGTLIGSARQDGEDADWLKVTVGGKDKELVPPDESAYLDVNELVNSVKNLLASNTVVLDIDLTGDKLAELLIANGVSSGYADLLKGLTLEIDGRASIDDLAAEVSVKLYGGDTTYLEMSAFYNYDTKAADESGVVPSNYGEVYVNISKLLGKDCAIKVYCDITEAVESINTLLSEAAQADAATLSESSGNALDLGDIQSIIEGVLTFDLTSLIGELSADAKGLTVTLNADELIGLFFDGSTVKVGTVTLTYNINNEEGAAVGTLSGSALGGGLKITVKGDANPLNAPDKDGYLNINTVLDLINKAKAAAQEIIDSRSVYFALGDSANAGAEVEVNGINVGISGTGEVKWDENGTVTNLALDIKLWIANGSAENSKSTTTVKLIYNNAVADDEPFVTLAINNVGIKITQNDIAQMGNDVNNLIANVTALINALTGGDSDGNGGNNGEITQQLLTTLAEAAGESTATAPAGSVTPADTDYLAIVKLVLGLLGGDDDTVGGSLGNVLEEALSSLLSGSSVSVGELGDSLKLILAGAADITLGVNDGALTLAGNISDIANLDISVSAGKFTNGAGTVASALEEQFNATTESGAVYTFYSASESGSFSKVIYDFVLGAYESIDIGSFLGGKTYQVTFSLAGDASGIEALSGVSVNATLYFGNGITNGELDKGKLLEADVDLTVDGFTFKANLFYNNRNFYISVSNIGGTSLSGLNVKVSADDIYAAAENIVALINNPKILALFTGADGEGAADIIGDGEGAENVSLISDETSSSLTDVIAAILGMKLSDVITISNSGTETLVTADIDKVLSEFGISQKVGPAQLVVDSGDSKKIALYLGNKDSEYNWLELVSELATDYNGSADSANLSSYIDIGFIDELISDLSKFITSNADSGDNGNISTLFSLTGGTINLSIDLSGVDMGLGGLGNSIVSGIVSAMDNIVIDNVNIVAGLKDGELYVSLKARINTVSAVGITIISGHEIGVTYSNGKITLSRYSGDSREYWIMTPEFFIDNMFAKNENGNDSPIRWIAGIEPILFNTVDIWGLVVDSLGDMVSGISSGTSQPDEVYLYNLYHTNPVAATFSSFGYEMPSTLANYLLGFATTAGGGVTVGNTEGVLENVEKPELADYYAISLNASALTGSVLDVLDIAISRDDTNGFGGIYAFASIQSRLLTVNFDIGYNGYDGDVFDSANDKYVPDYYAEAVAKAGGEDKIDFDYSEALKENDVYYADRVFGGVQISADGTVGTIMRQTVYKNDALTITVYESEDDYNNKVNAQTMQVKYKSTIYLHSASGVMVDEEGNTYIFVQVTEDGSIVTESDGTYPETAAEITSNATFYKMKIDDEKYRAMNVTVHNTANGSDDSVTLTVYSGTSLTEIAQRAFGGYTVLGGKWQMLGEGGVMVELPANSNVTIPEWYEGGIYSIDLFAQFVQSEVTINGVVYEFVQDETELGGHYEVKTYTSSLAVYYGAGSVLVLENDIDDVYPVTKIRESAFANATLKNVIIPENITYIGGSAFFNNYGIEKVIILADTVCFANDSTQDVDNNSQRYPFYGCTLGSSGENEDKTNLYVYYKNATCLLENGGVSNVNELDGGVFVVKRYTRDYLRTANYEKIDNSDWAYIDITVGGDLVDGYASNDIKGKVIEYLNANGYGYDGSIYNTTGCLFVNNLSSSTDAESIANYVEEKINEWTSSPDHGGAIGMYGAEVSFSSHSGFTVDSAVNAVRISVDITANESSEYYYPVTINYFVGEGDAAEQNNAAGTISYGEGLWAFNEQNWLSGENTVTISAANPQYVLGSVYVNGELVEGNGDGTYTITVNEATQINAYFTVNDDVHIISVYSDIDFKYGDDTYTNESGNTYEFVYDENVSCTPAALEDNSGYYFLGWAVDNGTTLEFTELSYTEGENITYYAIWGYSTQSLENVSQSSGSSLSELTNGAWYDGNFRDGNGAQTGALKTGVYTYYARWQYKLTFSVSYNSDTAIYVDGNRINGNTKSVDVEEGNYISISYIAGTHRHGIFSSQTSKHTLATIIIYDYKGANSSLDSFTLHAQCTKSTSSGDRRFKYVEATWSSNGWEHADIEYEPVTENGQIVNRLTGGSSSITIAGDASFNYEV